MIEIRRENPLKSPEKTPLKNDQVLDNLFKDSLVQSDFLDSGFRRSSKRKDHANILWSMTAAMIDGLLIISLTCLLLLFTSSVLLPGLNLKSNFWDFVLSFFLLVSTVYMTSLRVILGFSVGEWACDLQIGNSLQRLSRYFSVRIFARVLIVQLTGFILFPLLSLFFGKDILGGIVGAKLTSRLSLK